MQHTNGVLSNGLLLSGESHNSVVMSWVVRVRTQFANPVGRPSAARQPSQAVQSQRVRTPKVTETITTDKPTFHSCSAPRQIQLPTLTSLSSSHHLEQICCRYSQQRPPFGSRNFKLFWPITVCTCFLLLLSFLIPEHKCKYCKNASFNSSILSHSFSTFSPFFIIGFCWLLGGGDKIK